MPPSKGHDPSACPLCQPPDTAHLVVAEPDYWVVQVPDSGLPGFHRLIWRNHVQEVSELPPEARTRLFETLVDWESRLRLAYQPDKFNLASFGNVVPHLHWHLMPRWRTDAWWPQPIWAPPRDKEEEALGEGLCLQVGSWAQLKDAARSVRTQVFIEEQAVLPEEEWDPLDEVARHVVVRRAGDAIANGRLLSLGDGTARIGRIAVLKPNRGLGFGRRILTRLMTEARRLGFLEVVLHAQRPAIPFYENAGFVAEGSVFEECRIPHQTMRARLTY